MPTKRNAAVLVSALACIAAVGWMVYSFTSHRRDNSSRTIGSFGFSPEHEQPSPPPAAPAPSQTSIGVNAAPASPESRYIFEIASQESVAVRGALRDMVLAALKSTSSLPAEVGSAESLAEAMSEYVGTYATESAEAALKTLEASGVTVPENWRTNGMLESYHAKGSLWLRSVRFDPSGMTVRPLREKGVISEYKEPISANLVRRDDGRPSLKQVAPNEIYEYEIIMPALMLTPDNDKFQGRIGVALTWDPRLKKWFVTQFAVYDQPPTGSPTVPMPLL